ncbi:asparaginase [Achromobacter sp. 2789STDY5608621]|uniref:asparaginase n=1 Tax=Achromobacter sp. 2789STDY5608621 TaxID=1806496 RepID=UPI0006C3A7A7|nr:asparaginase [Achromobacter sp. 2789STDY5608621]CUI94649.1 L-asparaginase [Achromobacter sp. 2789STDY5608621]
MDLPRVLLLATGGTIAMTPGADGGIAPALDAHALVAAVPDLAAVASLEVIAFSNKPGASLTQQDLAQLAALIEEGFARGCQGAVVVQGTDTIDETAFALELLARRPLPIVVTGAMRGAAAPGADGPANLLAAVTVAAAPAAAGMGALVVLGDQVHAARHVQKAHTTLPSAFHSPGRGPLGTLCEGRLHLHARLTPLPALRSPRQLQEAPIALLRIGLDDDGRLLPALPDLGFRGAVIEAMGAGHVPGHLAPLLGDLAARMPVVLSTRVAAGPVLRAAYAFPGSEKDLLSRGLIHGGALGGLKARLLLRLLLATGASPEALPAEFARRCDALA